MKKGTILFGFSCLAMLLNLVRIAEMKTNAEGGVTPTQVAGLYGVDSTLTNDGVKVSLAGADTVGESAWSYQARVNNGLGGNYFSLADGKAAGFEFSVNMRNPNNLSEYYATTSDWSNLMVKAINADTGDEVCTLRICNNGDEGTAVKIEDTTDWSTLASDSDCFWIAGNASSASSFKIAFDKAHLFMSECSAWGSTFWSTVVNPHDHQSTLDAAKTTLATRLDALNNVAFMVYGSGGFSNGVDVTIKNLYSGAMNSIDWNKTVENPTIYSLAPFEASVATTGVVGVAQEATASSFYGATYKVSVNDGEYVDGLSFTPVAAGENTVKVKAIIGEQEFVKEFTVNTTAPKTSYTPNEIAKLYGVDSALTEKGVEITVPGTDTVGENAWSYQPRVNEDANLLFSLADGKCAGFEFSVNMRNKDNLSEFAVGSNDWNNLFIQAINADTGEEVCALKIFNNGENATGCKICMSGSPWTDYLTDGQCFWLNGSANENSSFKIAFDKTHLFMAEVSAWDNAFWTTVANYDNLTNLNTLVTDTLATKLAALENVAFRVYGSNGFTKEAKIVIKNLYSGVLTTQWNNTVNEPTVTPLAPFVVEGTDGLVGEEITLSPTSIYNATYKISVDGGDYVDGLSFTPTTKGEKTVSVKATIGTQEFVKEVKVGVEANQVTVKFGADDEGTLYDQDAAIVAPANPTKDAEGEYYYVFDGWYDGNTKFVEGTKASKDVTYTPVFVKFANALNLEGLDVNQIVGNWGIDSIQTVDGIKVICPGSDTMGQDAWKTQTRILGYSADLENNANLAAQFNVENGKSVEFTFSIDMRDSANTATIKHGSVNDPWAILIYVQDVDNGFNDIAVLRINTNDGPSCGVQVIDLSNNWKSYDCHFWIDGCATLDSQFTIKFDLQNLFQAKVSAWGDTFWARMDNSSSDVPYTAGAFAEAMADKFANVKNVSFKIQGNGGWDSEQTIILRSLNGVSFAKEAVTLTVDGVANKMIKGTVPTVTEPTKVGYTFAGWVDTEGKAVDLTVALNENLEIVSSWTINKYLVKFGENDTGSELEYDTEITIPANPTKEATVQYTYTFDGWYNGETKLVAGTKVTENVTFEAKFTETLRKYTVSFDEASVKMNYGATISAPEDPTKDGYRFLGWYAGDVAFVEGATVTGDVAYVACFEKIEDQPGDSSSTSEEPSPSVSEEPTDSSSSSQQASSSDVGKVVEEAKKGCGSAAIPSVIGLLTIAGALLVSKKRR